jgi:hypothetical protein
VSPVKYEQGFYIPEDDILHSHCREHLKSSLFFNPFTYFPLISFNPFYRRDLHLLFLPLSVYNLQRHFAVREDSLCPDRPLQVLLILSLTVHCSNDMLSTVSLIPSHQIISDM